MHTAFMDMLRYLEAALSAIYILIHLLNTDVHSNIFVSVLTRLHALASINVSLSSGTQTVRSVLGVKYHTGDGTEMLYGICCTQTRRYPRSAVNDCHFSRTNIG